MDVEFSAEQEQLRATVRAFLSSRAPLRPYARDHYERAWQRDEVWQGLADLGVLGLMVPEADGGAGEAFATMGVALEELGRAVCPAPVLTTAVGAAVALRAGSSDAARGACQALARGDAVVSLAVDHSRPWDRSPGATAEVGGGAVRVTGDIPWVADGGASDRLIVPALGPSGLGLFLVDATDGAVTTEPRAHVDGSRQFADLHLDAVEAQPLTGEADATAAVGTAVDALIVAYVMDGLGAAEAALALAVEYAGQRHQFGAPIGTFQAVQHLCADMLRDVETVRAVAYYALWAIDGADGAEAHRAATMAKAVAAEGLPRVGAACIQVHGGVGFTWEHDAHLFHKRLLTVQHVFGTADDHLDRIADFICDPAEMAGG